MLMRSISFGEVIRGRDGWWKKKGENNYILIETAEKWVSETKKWKKRERRKKERKKERKSEKIESLLSWESIYISIRKKEDFYSEKIE